MTKRKVGSQLAIWLLTIKSQESTRFPHMQVACDIPLETFRRGLQLCIRSHLNWRSTHKIMGPQVPGVSTLGISGLPFGSPRTKCHLDVGLVERHKIYYKGEGGGFPQVRVVVNLVSLNLPVPHPSTKSAPTMHYQLVVWFCVSLCEWLSACHFS
jgi:hypothetical protein